MNIKKILKNINIFISFCGDCDEINSRFLISFLMSFICMVVYSYLHRDITFGGDAYETWNVAKHFYEPNRLHSFVEYRGPFTFIFHNIIYSISQFLNVNDVVFFRLYSSLLFALLTSYFFPYLFSYILNMKIGLASLFLFSGMVFFFFRGYFLHPQTDFLAFTFLLLSVNILIFASNRHKNTYLYYCAAGVLFGCSVMTRYNYILSVPILVLFLMLTLQSRQTNKLLTFKLLTCFAIPCIVLVSANSFSTNNKLTSNNLLELKLKDGMLHQKIEWNAGDAKYPGALVVPERRGSEILRIEGVDTDPYNGLSVEKYFELYKKYPLDMVLISLQHLFNGLDITYSSVYIYDLHASRVLLSLVNYLVIFLSLVILSTKFSLWWRSEKFPLLLLSAIVIPTMSSIPFMVEVRFFMPLTMTFIGISIFGLRDSTNTIKANGLHMYLAFFVALCFLLSASVLVNAEKVIPLKIW